MKYAVEQAFGYFQHVAESVGAPVTSVALSPDGIRIARVIRDRAELRLSWSPSLRRLALEISHGPPDGAAVGRLELFDARTSNDAFLELSASGDDFESSVSYGLELMGFPTVVPEGLAQRRHLSSET